MSIVIKRMHAQLLGSNSAYISFDIGDISSPPDRYEFRVRRSRGYNDEWKTVAALIDKFSYVDGDVFMTSSNDYYVYQVVARDTKGVEDDVESDIVVVNQSKTNVVARRLQEKYQLGLKVTGGARSLYFQRRRGGFRCPICWNETTQTATRSSCLSCHGTGYMNGFFDPSEFYGQFSSRIKKIDNSMFQNDMMPISVIMGAIPPAFMGDFVYELSRNRLMEVKVVEPAESAGTVYAQRLTCAQIEQTNPFFSVVQGFVNDTMIREVENVHQGTPSL